VDLPCPFLAIEEADCHEIAHKSALLARPVNSKLNVLIAHTRQRAVAAVVSRPQEKTHEMPGSGNTSATNELLGLRMGGQPSGDTCVAGHRQAPIS